MRVLEALRPSIPETINAESSSAFTVFMINLIIQSDSFKKRVLASVLLASAGLRSASEPKVSLASVAVLEGSPMGTLVSPGAFAEVLGICPGRWGSLAVVGTSPRRENSEQQTRAGGARSAPETHPVRVRPAARAGH